MASNSTNRRTKRRAPWAAYLWPGLPHLWIRGSWAGLLLAIGFTVLLHVTVLATIVWPEWLPPRVVMGCGTTLGLLWLAALWETRGELRRIAAERAAVQQETSTVTDADSESADSRQPTADSQDKVDALFAAAQTRYLQADWVEAERALLELLRIDREDTEAQLLLATLWRRIGRTREARRRLRWLARREAAEGWLFEIQTELALCDAADHVETGIESDAEAVAEPVAAEETTPDEAQSLSAAEPADTGRTAPVRTDRNAA